MSSPLARRTNQRQLSSSDASLNSGRSEQAGAVVGQKRSHETDGGNFESAA
jgi:hypothetical protein